MTTEVEVQENVVQTKNGNEAQPVAKQTEQTSTLSTEKESMPIMRRFVENVEHAFDEWQRWGWPLPRFVPLPKAIWSREGADWMPEVEVLEKEGNFIVRAELPGLKREDIHVEIANGFLVLSGEREEKKEERENGYYRSERSYGKFLRSIPLPEGVNGDDARAEFKDGLLEVSMSVPVKEVNSRKIEVG